MSKRSELDRILATLKAQRDLFARSIQLVEDERAALAAKPKRIRKVARLVGEAS